MMGETRRRRKTVVEGGRECQAGAEERADTRPVTCLFTLSPPSSSLSFDLTIIVVSSCPTAALL